MRVETQQIGGLQVSEPGKSPLTRIVELARRHPGQPTTPGAEGARLRAGAAAGWTCRRTASRPSSSSCSSPCWSTSFGASGADRCQWSRARAVGQEEAKRLTRVMGKRFYGYFFRFLATVRRPARRARRRRTWRAWPGPTPLMRAQAPLVGGAVLGDQLQGGVGEHDEGRHLVVARRAPGATRAVARRAPRRRTRGSRRSGRVFFSAGVARAPAALAAVHGLAVAPACGRVAAAARSTSAHRVEEPGRLAAGPTTRVAGRAPTRSTGRRARGSCRRRAGGAPPRPRPGSRRR